MSIAIYIVLMAAVTYLIRMLPFTLMRKQIKSKFLKSFLYYIPYTVLTAMTVPAIFYSTGNGITAIVGTATALVLAYFKKPLIVVAISAAVTAFATALIV
ncbi:MAG: AzlD domain-containing protein [Acutalibacteraceae bacterium]|nr:AzlD domain-containing protein [Acutalibacteraceae bacterium]